MIPIFDNIKIADSDGYLTPEWRSLFQQLFEVLQKNMGSEGLVMPSQTSANIALLTNSPDGAMVYDVDNNLANIRINNSWKTITTS